MLTATTVLRAIREAAWHETYPAAEYLARYPHRFVHFSDVPKLGVNPSKSHRDPPGIYFYPNQWLLDNYRGFQYGLVSPYAFIASIQTRAKGVVNLGRMTRAQALTIARAN